MFVKINRVNHENQLKELIVDTEQIAFITETRPYVNYDKPTKFDKLTNEDTGEIEDTPIEWETEERFLIAFKNGKQPQNLNKENYEILKEILTK